MTTGGKDKRSTAAISFSAICRTRTSSIIYRSHMEMRKVKHGELDMDVKNNLSFWQKLI
jgi:hypothetical protein